MAPDSGDRLSRIQVSSAVPSGPANNASKLVKEESRLKINLIKKLLSGMCATKKTKFSVIGQWVTDIHTLNSQQI